MWLERGQAHSSRGNPVLAVYDHNRHTAGAKRTPSRNRECRLGLSEGWRLFQVTVKASKIVLAGGDEEAIT